MLMSTAKLLPRDTVLESGSTLTTLPANADAENRTPKRRRYTADSTPYRAITIPSRQPDSNHVYSYGHFVPFGSPCETVAKSTTLTPPSTLASALGSKPGCPIFLPKDAFTIAI